nr:o-methyltransferase lepi [Quercus suber]
MASPQQGRDFNAIIAGLSQGLQGTKSPAYFVNTLIQSIPLLSTIRVCLEAGILDLLAKSPKPLTADEIALAISKDTDAEAKEDRRDFVVRMLRGVGAFGMVDEVDKFTYLANDLTRTIANPAFVSGFKLVYDDNMGPKSIMSEMVTYHKANDWRGSPSGQDGPYQRSKDCVGMSSFHHWAEYNPTQNSRLSDLMQVAARHRVHYFEWFPASSIFTPPSAGQKFTYVDVGGGRGHDIRGLAAKYPTQDARFVLEDLPVVVAETEQDFAREGAVRDARIEILPHDFFQPQPIKGANVYYLHKIFHDWPDKDCVRILEALRDAMSEHSRILICDFILPDKGCSLLQTAFDIDMLSLHSGAERDEEMWKRLIAKAPGLKLVKLWQSPSPEGEGIVEVVKDA